MSDDQSDAEFEASLANLDGGSADDADTAELDPAALDPAELPSVVGRLESVRSTVSTLGMRIDALVTSTTSYRSALTDRLNEYSELVTKTTRAQATDLDDYRKTAERAVNDVRRSMQAAEESMQRISSRLDDLAAAGDDEDGRRVVTEVRSILDAQERLSDFLTEALDRFGATVVERIDRSQEGLTGDLAALRGAVDAAAADQSALAGLRDDVAALRDAVGGPVGDRLDRLQEGVQGAVDELGGRIEALTSDGALTTALRVDLGTLNEQVSELRGQVGAVAAADPAAEVRAELEPIRSGLDRLEGRLADTVEHDALVTRLDGLATAVQALGADEAESEAIRTLLGELQVTMLDVASGEVVGALWDEVRALRGVLDTVADRAARAAESGADDAAVEALHAIRETLASVRDEARSADASAAESVQALRTAVEALGSEVRSVDSSTGQGLDGIHSTLGSLVEEVRSRQGESGQGLEELGSRLESLAEEIRSRDVATPEDVEQVRSRVGDLFGEIRALVESVEGLAAEPADAPADDAPAPATAEQLSELSDLVRGLREQVDTARSGTDQVDSATSSILDQVTSLREELAEGLVIEPSESISGTLHELQDTVAGLKEALENRPDPDDGDDTDTATAAALDALRSAVDELHTRLDEGLVLAEETDEGERGEPSSVPSVSAEQFADQIAALRDLISTEMSAVQDRIGVLVADQGSGEDEIELTVDVGPFEDAVNALRDEIRSMATAPGEGDGPTGIDADVVDLLREEIRAAGGVADGVVDALRDELKALRRRLAVKADEKVLDDAQLAQIADAVAERLDRS